CARGVNTIFGVDYYEKYRFDVW
nr:immunoglobulin heavy chain junction region [Macaca mulatta]MOX01703.1 immunoglobulin heavy chain junction region [Macaca mulatta]MOX02735.1 immunoglobulin heavy chain junction region [Macaca mulatta]MOX02789.1 immunoglobulin heavy chain junction region [Macaca mulatta]MOX04898.1 immunoglobulin heavy chain junction region [Macaca mulatta]